MHQGFLETISPRVCHSCFTCRKIDGATDNAGPLLDRLTLLCQLIFYILSKFVKLYSTLFTNQRASLLGLFHVKGHRFKPRTYPMLFISTVNLPMSSLGHVPSIRVLRTMPSTHGTDRVKKVSSCFSLFKNMFYDCSQDYQKQTEVTTTQS